MTLAEPRYCALLINNRAGLCARLESAPTAIVAALMMTACVRAWKARLRRLLLRLSVKKGN
ncbi:hypothetical protein C6495_09090 [Candidatus Poribacteria bacterium]|nr:MAG: hypothetical protein C6495_09090 [Candidatus Poribacteria bacterium]